MDRFNDLLSEVAKAASEKYGGTKRSDLKDSDFLFPETRSFPIVTPKDVPDAISNFGRMKSNMSYQTFLRKLYNMTKRKGPEFVAALPEASKQQLGLKKNNSKSYVGNLDDDLLTPTETNYFELDRVNLANLKTGDMVKNVNESCKHYGSEGYVDDVSELPDFMGQVVRYTASNSGPTWSKGDKLVKTPNQLVVMHKSKVEGDGTQVNEMGGYQGNEGPVVDPTLLMSQGPDFQNQTQENETEPSTEMDEYKDEYLEMSIASIKAIAAHAHGILSALEDNEKKDTIEENLTESWLQGKIAVTEENMRTIHDFVMFSEPETDTEDSEAAVEPTDIKKKHHKLTIKQLPTSRFYNRKDPFPDVQDPQNKDIDNDNTPYLDDFSGVWAEKKPGLWDNIRKKKEREGKNYKPTKPGEKGRPSPEQWNKLTKKKDNS